MEVKIKKFEVNAKDLIAALKSIIEDLESNKPCEGECSKVDNTNKVIANLYVRMMDSLKKKFLCNDIPELCTILSMIKKVNPAAVFNIMSKEIAILLDENHPGDISSCDVVYGISLLDGRIQKINRKWIKTFKNFAAFRTIEDAKLACKILKTELKDMFGGK